jgi:pimeloyl-ACP methyl ester carboxylesterase
MLASVGEPLRTVQTSDGRTLAFAVWGDPQGFPVMSLHGTPGCRLNRWPREELYESLGVCWVTHDRAGYGRSSRWHGRNVADAIDDVIAVADELGLDRFGVSGGSGGGPHVLACAALHPDRVVRATCSVGVAPYGGAGLDHDEWLDGMDPENVKEFGLALRGEEAVTEYVEAAQADAEARVAVDPSTLLDDFDLSESDRAQLARPEVMEVLREATAEWAVNGVGGWVDDDLAFTRSWGFDVSDVAVPVLVLYGAVDVLVPPAHGEWLASHVPGCIVKVEEGGHLGLDPETEAAENVRWLREGVAPEGAYSPSEQPA